MNSLKLLAFGNSLAAGREVVGRFREREDCVLPRFAAAAHGRDGSWWRRLLARFRPGPPAGLESPVSTSPVQAPALLLESSTLTAEPTAGEPAIVSLPAAPPTVADRGAITQRLVTARQREFRFEHVTVVCNDLHDADLEFISLKSGDDNRMPAERQRNLLSARAEI